MADSDGGRAAAAGDGGAAAPTEVREAEANRWAAKAASLMGRARDCGTKAKLAALTPDQVQHNAAMAPPGR